MRRYNKASSDVGFDQLLNLNGYRRFVPADPGRPQIGEVSVASIELSTPIVKQFTV